jgi:hypothetical protein
MALAPRVVVVHRRTELDDLVARHGTRGQASFFLQTRGRTLADVETSHTAVHDALTTVAAAIPLDWRRGTVERSDLGRFSFAPEDIIVAVGQDGLVANAAKYLTGQPVIGIDPEPGRNAGVLVTHPATATPTLLTAAARPDRPEQRRTMVRARLDDGQTITALNEVYIGHQGHQSARYRLTTSAGEEERQSSSGILVGTGTGATGWCRSAWLERHSTLTLPAPTETALCWFVREAWPSPTTGADHTEGLLEPGDTLTITAGSDLVVFGDGIEHDALPLLWGQTLTIDLAPHHLHLI